MTLSEANKQLKQLENDYNYYLAEKERILSMVLPKATDIKGEIVDGGKRMDRLLTYVEEDDEKKINETLDYIYKKQENLMKWVESELKRIGEHNKKALKIYELRFDEEYMKTHGGKKREWWKIGQAVDLSPRQCQRILKNIVKKRNI